MQYQSQELVMNDEARLVEQQRKSSLIHYRNQQLLEQQVDIVNNMNLRHP
jgi:hypothetical protein